MERSDGPKIRKHAMERSDGVAEPELTLQEAQEIVAELWERIDATRKQVVEIDIEIDVDTLLALTLMAHKENITLNALIVRILRRAAEAIAAADKKAVELSEGVVELAEGVVDGKKPTEVERSEDTK